VRRARLLARYFLVRQSWRSAWFPGAVRAEAPRASVGSSGWGALRPSPRLSLWRLPVVELRAANAVKTVIAVRAMDEVEPVKPVRAGMPGEIRVAGASLVKLLRCPKTRMGAPRAPHTP